MKFVNPARKQSRIHDEAIDRFQFIWILFRLLLSLNERKTSQFHIKSDFIRGFCLFCPIIFIKHILFKSHSFKRAIV